MKKLLFPLALFLLGYLTTQAQENQKVSPYVHLQFGGIIPTPGFRAYAAAEPGTVISLDVFYPVYRELGIVAMASSSSVSVNESKLSSYLEMEYSAGGFMIQSGKWENKTIMGGVGYSYNYKQTGIRPYIVAGYAEVVRPAQSGYYEKDYVTWHYDIQRSLGYGFCYGAGLNVVTAVEPNWALSFGVGYSFSVSRANPFYFTYQINNPSLRRTGQAELQPYFEYYYLSIGISHNLGRRAEKRDKTDVQMPGSDSFH